MGNDRAIVISVSVLSLVSCAEPHDAQFRYNGCCVACEITTPMMVGDEEDVTVTGSIPDAVSVDSTTPSSVAVLASSRRCCPTAADASTASCRTVALNDVCKSDEKASLSVAVKAPAEGASDLLIKKSDGSLWAAVTLSVEKAASLALACNTQGAVTLAPSGSCAVSWKATDAKGGGLMSTAGIFLTSSDPTIVIFDGFHAFHWSEIGATPCLSGDVSMFALSPGNATVTATGGGATETLAVHVTP